MLINYFISSTVLNPAMGKEFLSIHVEFCLLVHFLKNLSQLDLKLGCTRGRWIQSWLAGPAIESLLLLEISRRGSDGMGVCRRTYISIVNAIIALLTFQEKWCQWKLWWRPCLWGWIFTFNWFFFSYFLSPCLFRFWAGRVLFLKTRRTRLLFWTEVSRHWYK